MAGTSKSAEEEELINEIAAEQQVLCEQAKEYRKCSLAERIAQATAYRNKQLRRWDERGLPLLQFLVSSGPAKTTRVKFDGSYSLIDASSRDDVEEGERTPFDPALLASPLQLEFCLFAFAGLFSI